MNTLQRALQQMRPRRGANAFVLDGETCRKYSRCPCKSLISQPKSTQTLTHDSDNIIFSAGRQEDQTCRRGTGLHIYIYRYIYLYLSFGCGLDLSWIYIVWIQHGCSLDTLQTVVDDVTIIIRLLLGRL